MERFWTFVTNAKSVTSWVAKAVVAVPLMDFVTGLGPPWPTRASVGIVTALAEIVVLIYAFQFWGHASKRRRERIMFISLSTMLSLGIGYLVLFSFFTFEHPRQIRGIKGIVLRPSVKEILDKGVDSDVDPPVPSEIVGIDSATSGAKDRSAGSSGVGATRIAPEDLLPEAEYEATSIWEPWSVSLMRVVFLIVWDSFFVSLTAFIGAFVLLQPPHATTGQTAPSQMLEKSSTNMDVCKIVLFAANPMGTGQLALDKEVREIEAKIRAAEHRDTLKLISKWAVRPDDLLQALNEHQPQIVQFSGHGSPSEAIILNDSHDRPKPVSKVALASLFSTLKDNVRLVILNACYSDPQAEAIIETIDCAIGMTRAIGDEAAIQFAASFYRAIGFGRSIQDAFDQGKTALLLEGIPEETTPRLHVRKGVAPSQIVLVRAAITTKRRRGQTIT